METELVTEIATVAVVVGLHARTTTPKNLMAPISICLV
jgi:hypothetical protein